MTATVEQVLYDCRDTWAQTLASLARADERVVAVVNDSVGSSKLVDFQEEFPERTINVGIAEQNMVGISAGLANSGRIPFVSAAGCFLTARAMEQIKADVAYSEYNVKLIGQSPGVAYGDLGPTHHSIEDFSWLRAIPGLTVLSPSDPLETEQAVRWAAAYDGPVYLRVPRMKIPAIYPANYQFEAGKAVTLREGTAVTIIATGTTVARALEGAELLAQDDIEARVLSMPTIKPIDADAIGAAARQTGAIVTVEEALTSGLGAAVAEVVVQDHPVPMRFVGFADTFAETGSAEWLFDRHGINAAGIRTAARSVLNVN